MSEAVTAEQAAAAEAKHLAPLTAAQIAASKPAPLTTGQKASTEQAEAERKVAEKKADALAKAEDEFKQDVAAAVAKREKAREQYPDESLGGIVERAWNVVRGVDPCYADCAGPFREKLMTHAESVQRVGVPAENASEFETEVGRLLGEQKKKAHSATAQVGKPAAVVAPPATPTSPVALRQGRLADDFPHRAALEAAGINTYGQARKAHESSFADVSGIGEARAAEIGKALDEK